MQTSTASGSTNSHTNGKTLVDLEKLAQEHTAGSMNSLDEFAKYWNEFDGIARGLVETKVISKVERDLLFWTGLPFATRKAFGQHMATVDLGYNERLVPTWRDAIQAGRHVFHDPSTRQKQDNEVDKLVRALHGLNVDDSNYAVAYARLLISAPSVADRISPPLRWTRPTMGSALSVPCSPTNSPAPQSIGSGGTMLYRPALRRVQSYVSYHWCPSCADQHAMQRHHTS